MASIHKGYQAMSAVALWERRRLGTAALTVLAVGALAAAMALPGGVNHASAQMALSLHSVETFGVSDGSSAGPEPGLWRMGAREMSATWPAVPPYSSDLRSPTMEGPRREIHVWATLATVGMDTDGASTHTSHIPGAEMGAEAGLSHTSFSYAGVDCNVSAVFRQQAPPGIRQAAFNADGPLPQDLALYAGDGRFAVFDSPALGLGKNMHVRQVDESPGWQESRRIPVALLARAGSMCG